MKERETDSSPDKNILQTAILLTVLPTWVAFLAGFGYIASTVDIGSVKVEFDEKLVGIHYDTFKDGTDCHIGIHPTGGNHDFHQVCINGSGNYITIIPNIRP